MYQINEDPATNFISKHHNHLGTWNAKTDMSLGSTIVSQKVTVQLTTTAIKLHDYSKYKGKSSIMRQHVQMTVQLNQFS